MLIQDILRLLRVEQWYKNILIFIALFFSLNFLNFNLFLLTLIGFCLLCLISSAGYIINDLLDMKVDQLHPEKLIRRPLAAEKIRPSFAVIISIILGFFSIILSLLLSYTFGLAVILLFVVFLLYSLFLKHISIIDIHVLALGHVIRAASGALLIGVFISPWMLTFVFLLALFLAVGKRRADLSLLKNAQAHKKVYKVYTRQLLDRLSVILLGLMLLVYILYVVINHYSLIMLITIPLGSVIIFRYLYFISTNHVIARRTELIFKDKICILFFILWFIFCFVGLYLI